MKLNRLRWTILALPLRAVRSEEDSRAEDPFKSAYQSAVFFSAGVHPETLQHFSRGPESDRLALINSDYVEAGTADSSVQPPHGRANPRTISPPRKSSPCAASMSRIMMPRAPSAEWYTSKSATLTPSSAASVKTSAAAPGRSGMADADLGQVGGAGDPAGQVGPGRAGAGEHGRGARRVAPATTSRMRPSPVDQAVEPVDDGDAVLVADVGPDGRVPGGDAGHVAEAAGGQAQQGGVLLGPLVGQRHQRGGGRGGGRG